MAISASQITTNNTLEQFRTEFNNLRDDVSGLESGTATFSAISATTLGSSSVNVQQSGAVVFEGASANAFESTLAVLDPTADRTITLPNQSGLVSLIGGIKTAADDDIVLDGTDATGLDADSRLLLEDVMDGDTGSFLSQHGVTFEDNTLIATTLSSAAFNVSEDGTIKFEGATDNTFETTLTVVDPTLDRTISFPNQTGLISLVSGVRTAADDDVVLDGTDSSSTDDGGRLLLEDVMDGDTGSFLSSHGVTFANNDLSLSGKLSVSGGINGNLPLTSDSSALSFGLDSEITLTHVADTGLLLKNTNTADDSTAILTIATGETDIQADDVIGQIDFQAPDEGTGTDAILVASTIKAVSEGDFSSSNNATTLELATGRSAAAGSDGGRVRLTSTGGLEIKNQNTADDSFSTLTLQTGDDDIAADDVLGRILFQAPDEGTGTDAITAAARIQALSEGDFSSSNNATSLEFRTATSGAVGTAAQGGKLTLTSEANLLLKDVDTTDGSSPTITLQSGDTNIEADDVLGTINFQAPDEGTGTDAILVASTIKAFSEGDFSSSNNATTLELATGRSAAAGSDGGRLQLTSAGILSIKNQNTADDSNATLILQSGDTDIAADDVLGSILFQAPDEGTGTDAITSSARIQALSEGDFSSSNNATSLEFRTATSGVVGTAAQGSRLTLTSDANLIVKDMDTADGSSPTITLQTGDTDMQANDVLGKIAFQAPDEGTGTDAILVAGSMDVFSESDFSSSSNATSMRFLTGNSAAAGSDGGSMILGSTGNLTLKDLRTADGSSPTFTLQSGDTDIAVDDILGTINFQAPDEGTGTDAILVAAGISAVSEGDFSSSSNATSLKFITGNSAAAGNDGGSLILGSTGNLTLKDLRTADGSSPTITMQSGDTDIAADDVLGTINFQAPDEGTGTDSILVASTIKAFSEGDFSSSNNATTLELAVGRSAAAGSDGGRLQLTSTGNLILKNQNTADDSFPTMTLQTGDTDIADGDVLGRIEFQAPDEGAGTDAILVAAAIQATGEDDFSSSKNETSIEFLTATSAIARKVAEITSAGVFNTFLDATAPTTATPLSTVDDATALAIALG